MSEANPYVSPNQGSPYPVPGPYDKAAYVAQPGAAPYVTVQPPTYGAQIHVSGDGVQQPATVVYVQSGATPHVTVPTVDLDHLDHMYHTCCCHVKTAGYVIGIIEGVALIISLIATIAQYADCYWTECYAFYDSMLISIIAFILGAVVLILLFIGLAREIPALIIPHIVGQGIGIAGLAVFLIIYIVAAAGGIAVGSGDVLVVAIIGIVLFGVAIGVEGYFMNVTIKCFRYLQVKTRSRY